MKRPQSTALYVGISEQTVKATVSGIKDIIRMKASDAVKLAAVHALAQATQPPKDVSISNCAFNMRPELPASLARRK